MADEKARTALIVVFIGLVMLLWALAGLWGSSEGLTRRCGEACGEVALPVLRAQQHASGEIFCTCGGSGQVRTVQLSD